jgi:hypothetical protein
MTAYLTELWKLSTVFRLQSAFKYYGAASCRARGVGFGLAFGQELLRGAAPMWAICRSRVKRENRGNAANKRGKWEE